MCISFSMVSKDHQDLLHCKTVRWTSVVSSGGQNCYMYLLKGEDEPVETSASVSWFGGERPGLLFLLNWASGSVGLIISSVGTGSQARIPLSHEALAGYEHISFISCLQCLLKATQAACQAVFRFTTLLSVLVNCSASWISLAGRRGAALVGTSPPWRQRDHSYPKWLVQCWHKVAI